MVTVPPDVLDRYERFSLYNSPYSAHDTGCAIDLYPGDDDAISPVAGTVLDTRRVRCPDQPYAVAEDSLLLVDCGTHVARILHVDPAVEPGESVEIGDSLGTLVRSGFFGRWVDNHLHLGFRHPDQNLERASGSLPVEPETAVSGVGWDGTGTVTETGKTHVLLDSPSHAGRGFAALASDDGTPLDGGLPHYSGGGVLKSTDGAIALLGATVGDTDGRTVEWRDVAVYADRKRATGLSLFASQGSLGAKIVFHEGHGLDVGDRVRVTIEPTEEPRQLG
ncbi:hypothetical protein KM295_11240 [Natronomonas sp. F2-12]|jgi:hypothetical protein|uniref:Peptidase M23 domain-containing protein n=1 Tax=Natronomonas aquatica TaxID=2841590 RepID=A0A9R1CUW0_9EURY|nr:hypothetical protein [Natronomonas aquatica]MCQ4334041.1 hypothetical protein [Natronomonas aquatica]